MDCPHCGREMEERGQPNQAWINDDDDVLAYYCGMCETDHVYDHATDEFIEEE